MIAECGRKTTITYLANGTISEVSYHNQTNTTCYTNVNSANWENIENTTYIIDYGNNDSGTRKITFFENNSMCSFISIQEYNGTSNTYKATYKKY
ncbi:MULTISPECIES: hypothetical protein [unclassified Polaribacter]|uniref:hypothetical protein n=1 Tax=unclassified Polaribacter TaxID=196858 RepID=UPI0011BDC7EA|nr:MULTISPECIES: hypothetical protein [unclassified Polaribacter]TXD50273.1 hypothetical protein ES043_16715 [Polaribacter sp. IC063]TXD58433.1 hypothetical protein ES044_12365 [Polaribacter sp. IC066]